MKAATLSVATSYVMYGFQSTPPVKAATPRISQVLQGIGISIHAAREGGDTDTSSLSAARARFQSTPPVKAATQEAVVDAGLYEISIHAAREGGDGKITCPLMSWIISIHAAREGGDGGNV